MGRTTPPRLFGRSEESRALGEALDRLASGCFTILPLEGEAGIGKSRLLDSALERARTLGLQVVTGRAAELERNRPFGLLSGALRCDRSAPEPRRAAIATLVAGQGAGDRGPITVTSDPGLQFRAVDAFVDLVEELALAGPLVLGLDDLQWADPSSLLTLGVLVGRLRYLPVGLLTCRRPTPCIAELASLTETFRRAGARPLVVGPLTDEAVQELVAEVVAGRPGERLLDEAAGAAGNPLFLTELLGALLEEGAIARSGDRAEATGAQLPPTLRLTILHRMSFLPEPALTALRAASVLGSAFSLGDLATVTGRSALELSMALGDAIRSGVLLDDGAGLRFRHDLVRDSVYEDLPASVRRGLHREAGQRLHRAGASAVQVAEHLARAAVPGDAEAVDWLVRAAREAAGRSPAAAAELLAQAVALTASTGPARDRLVAEQASSLLWAGRFAQAEAACRTLLRHTADPGAEAAARVCLGHALLMSGRPGDAVPELDRAAATPALGRAERANVLGWAGIARLWLADLPGSAAAAERARSLAEVAGDHLATSLAMAALALVAELRGRLDEAASTFEQAVALADRSPERRGHRHPVHVPQAYVLVELDRLAAARETLEAGRRVSDELGLGWHASSYQIVSAFERVVAGEWDDAIAELEGSVGPANETGQTYSLILGCSLLALVRLHRNELPAARDAADTALRQLSSAGPRYREQWAARAHALVLEAEGRAADAFATLADCWDRCAELGVVQAYRMLGVDLVRLALRVGDAGRARDVAAAVAELADANDVASLRGTALHCRGLAESDPAVLTAAVDALSGSPRPLERALAEEDAGAALLREDGVAAGRPLLEQAVGCYERLEADRDLARADGILRAAGVRRGRRGPRGRPRTGWPSLTATERTIAALVAEGLSNPQIGARLFVSRRTVQTHVAHIFLKLGISSRVQLATELTRQRDAGRVR